MSDDPKPGNPNFGHQEAGSLAAAADRKFFNEQGSTQAQNRAELQQEFAPDPFAWADFVGQRIVLSMGQYGELNGIDLEEIKFKYGNLQGPMFDAIYNQFFPAADERMRNAPSQVQADIALGTNPADYGVMGLGSVYYQTDIRGLDEMSAWALQWMAAKSGYDLQPFVKSGSGSRGSGSRGLTAQEIRNKFDLDALADAINQMNRGLVLEEHGDAKGLARKYVDAIVATKAEKEIDFETFVRTRIEATARFKSIYKRKPEAVSAEAYIAPYLQAALQMASPDEAADIAIGGAQFGASAETFRQRLARTSSATGGAPFINALEGRMSDLSQILRG